MLLKYYYPVLLLLSCCGKENTNNFRVDGRIVRSISCTGIVQDPSEWWTGVGVYYRAQTNGYGDMYVDGGLEALGHYANNASKVYAIDQVGEKSTKGFLEVSYDDYNYFLMRYNEIDNILVVDIISTNQHSFSFMKPCNVVIR